MIYQYETCLMSLCTDHNKKHAPVKENLLYVKEVTLTFNLRVTFSEQMRK